VYHVVYVSRETRPFGPVDAEEVLSQARAFNASRGVTGLLVHAAGSFLQVLEGERDDVEAVFARVVASSRHEEVLRTPPVAVPARVFPEWSMGFAHAADGVMVDQVLRPLVRHDLIAGSRVKDVLLARYLSSRVA
jgi:hypothetical protein